MTIRKRTGAVALGVLVVLLAGHPPTFAQDPAPKAPAPTPTPAPAPAVKKQDPTRRVPKHFGQIGLTPEQRTNIHGVRAKHLDKIEALEKQIADQKAQMLAESEAVLTDTQRKLLENLRQAAVEAAARPAPVAKTAN